MINKDIFCDLIRDHEKSMYAVAFSIVNNESDSGEIVSESIYRAYANLDSLKDETKFKSWILRIVHNTAVEYIRKNSRVVSSSDVNLSEPHNEMDIATSISLKEAVNQLRYTYRTVVILFYYEDIPISQIAKITDTSIVTVKQRLSRARKQLREILKEDFKNE